VEKQVSRAIPYILSGVMLILFGVWMSLPTEPENTRDQDIVWSQLFKCRFNVRYCELSSDPAEKELLPRWKSLEEAYRQLYDRDYPDESQSILDSLYLEMCAIEHDETPTPDMKLIRQAEADVRAEVEQGTWP
jgi:hypothetical protein